MYKERKVEMDLGDAITCEGVAGMLDIAPNLDWRINRRWPFWKHKTEETKHLYESSLLSVDQVREISKFFQERIDFNYVSRAKLQRLLIALANEGVRMESIWILLNKIARFISDMKVNKLLRVCDWFVQYDIK